MEILERSIKHFRHALVLTLVATALCTDSVVKQAAESAPIQVASAPSLTQRVARSFIKADQPARLYLAPKQESVECAGPSAVAVDGRLVEHRRAGAYFFRTPPPLA